MSAAPEININAPDFNHRYREAHTRSIQGVPPRGAGFREEIKYAEACVFVALADKALRGKKRPIAPKRSFSRTVNSVAPTITLAPASEIEALTQALKDFVSRNTGTLRRQSRPVAEKMLAFLRGELTIPKEHVSTLYDLVGKVSKITRSQELKNTCSRFRDRLGTEYSKQEWKPKGRTL